MPRAYDPNLDDPNAENLEGPGTQTVAGGSGTMAPQTNAPSAQDRGKPTQSGSWTNLDNYFNANAGQGFGEKVAGKVGADVDAASNQIDAASQEFKNRSDAGTTRADESLLSGVSQDPTAIANDEAKLAAFKKQRDAQYAGPSSFADTADLYGKTWGAVDSASTKAKSSDSEGGRYALLDNYFGRSDYSGGQKGLDNLLVANDPNSRQAFQNVQAKADAAKGKFNTAGNEAATYAATNRGVVEGTRKQAADAVAASKSATQQAIDNYYGELKAKADMDRGNFVNSTPKQYGVDPSKFLTTVEADAMQTATPEMRARLNALAALSDQDATEWDSDPITSLGGADTAGYEAAVQTAKGKYDGLAKQLSDQGADLTSRRKNLELQLLPGAPEAKGIDYSPTTIRAEIAKLDKQLATLAAQRKNLDAEYGIESVAAFDPTNTEKLTVKRPGGAK